MRTFANLYWKLVHLLFGAAQPVVKSIEFFEREPPAQGISDWDKCARCGCFRQNHQLWLGRWEACTNFNCKGIHGSDKPCDMFMSDAYLSYHLEKAIHELKRGKEVKRKAANHGLSLVDHESRRGALSPVEKGKLALK